MTRARVTAFLFTAKGRPKPWQVICFFPGAGAFRKTSSVTDRLSNGWQVNGLLKSGRAVLYPIYKGMYERGDDPSRPDWSEGYA